MKSLFKLMLVMIFLLSGAVAANAQTAEGDWQYRLGTFMWAADVKMKLETPTTTIDSTVPFQDMLEYVVPSISLTFAAKKDKWDFHANFLNVYLSNDFESAGLKRGVKMSLNIPEAFVGYEVLKTNLTDGVPLTIEPYAGIRHYVMRTQIDRLGGGELVDSRISVTDAIVGMIATVGIGEKMSLTLRGDAGGLGLGGDSFDEDYFGMAMFNWNYSKNRTISLGYAYLKVAKDNIGHNSDLNTEFEFTGPILSHTFKF